MKTYDSHAVLPNGVIEVRLSGPEGVSRYTVAPGDAVDGEPAEVQAAASAAWTPAVVAAYAEALAEAAPPLTPEQAAEFVRVRRQAAYQHEADPLFFKWQRGESTEQEWRDKVEEIRARHPNHEN